MHVLTTIYIHPICKFAIIPQVTREICVTNSVIMVHLGIKASRVMFRPQNVGNIKEQNHTKNHQTCNCAISIHSIAVPQQFSADNILVAVKFMPECGMMSPLRLSFKGMGMREGRVAPDFDVHSSVHSTFFSSRYCNFLTVCPVLTPSNCLFARLRMLSVLHTFTLLCNQRLVGMTSWCLQWRLNSTLIHAHY